MTSPGTDPERRDDPLIEACLDEIMGGRKPPDLKQSILERAGGQAVVPPPFQTNPAPPPIQPVSSQPTNGAAYRSHKARRSPRSRYAWAIVSCVAIGMVSFLVYDQIRSRRLVVQDPVEPAALQAPAPLDAPPERQPEIRQPKNQQRSTPPAVSTENDEPPGDPGGALRLVPESGLASESPPAREALIASDEQIVELINARIQDRWQRANLQPSSEISDERWNRRIFLSLLGRSIREDELRRFLRSDAGDKRTAVLDEIFTEPRYKKEFSTYWGQQWSDRLLAHPHDERTARSMRAGLARYLKDVFAENRGHDEWVADLITATGSNSLRDDDYNGATNYLLALADGKGVRTAAELCRVLLGRRAQCAQCHDDSLAGITKQQFWQMTAFFRQMQVVGLRPGKARLSNTGFAGDPGALAGGVRFQEDDGEWQTAFPIFIDGTEIEHGGELSAADRRSELARIVTGSDLFAQATVNRVWSQLLGYGFTSPVDDMGRHNSASHPALLDSLSRHFVGHGYDTQRLIRWIVMSDPFNRSSVITFGNKTDTPEFSFEALFSRHYGRPSLFGSSKVALTELSYTKRADLATRLWDTVMAQTFERRDDAKPLDFESQLTISQLRLARSLAHSRISDDEKLRHVFLAILSRDPNPAELQRVTELYEAGGDNKIKTMESFIWALTRTQEYADEH